MGGKEHGREACSHRPFTSRFSGECNVGILVGFGPHSFHGHGKKAMRDELELQPVNGQSRYLVGVE